MVGAPLFSCIISYQGEYGRKMPNIYAYGKNLVGISYALLLVGKIW